MKIISSIYRFSLLLVVVLLGFCVTQPTTADAQTHIGTHEYHEDNGDGTYTVYVWYVFLMPDGTTIFVLVEAYQVETPRVRL